MSRDARIEEADDVRVEQARQRRLGTPRTPTEDPADLDRSDPERHIAQAAEAYRNWGRWGDDDRLGTLNFIGDAERARAAALVRRGASFSLSQPFDMNGPQQGWRRRTNPVHTMLDTGTDAAAGTQGFPHGIGGADKVMAMASSKELWNFLPPPSFTDIAFFIGAGLTMMLGSIPQQDVFQRVMSAKDADTARNGAVIGGVSYILFAFVPMFIVASAVVVMGDSAMELAKNDYQRVLPTFVLTKMPLVMQILFFGALLSAIKSTSSATLLAPSTSFVENILKNLRPHMSDRQQLFAMRATIVCFTGLVLAYAIAMKGTSIYDLVSSAYQVTLVGAFVPLVMGLYWKRATTQGAVTSVAAGIAVWILFFPQVGGEVLSKAFPAQLAGLIAAFLGMVAGSLAPQKLRNRHEHAHHLAGLPAQPS